MGQSRYQQPLDDKVVNNLTTRSELVTECDGLGIDIRRRMTGYLYRNPEISGNQLSYMSRFSRRTATESSRNEASFGRYHIAKRIQSLFESDTIPEDELITDVDELERLYEDMPDVTVYCGTACSGKNYHGEVLSTLLGVEAIDTDVFHPQRNVDKMHASIPLDDADRKIYISNITDYAYAKKQEGKKLGLIFPAHTVEVRELLREVLGTVVFVRFSAKIEDLLLRANSRHHDYISNANNSAFIQNQVRINQPLTAQEIVNGDFEVRTDEGIPLEQVRKNLHTGLEKHWDDVPLKNVA